jgi:hypothetical protein
MIRRAKIESMRGHASDVTPHAGYCLAGGLLLSACTTLRRREAFPLALLGALPKSVTISYHGCLAALCRPDRAVEEAHPRSPEISTWPTSTAVAA